MNFTRISLSTIWNARQYRNMSTCSNDSHNSMVVSPHIMSRLQAGYASMASLLRGIRHSKCVFREMWLWWLLSMAGQKSGSTTMIRLSNRKKDFLLICTQTSSIRKNRQMSTTICWLWPWKHVLFSQKNNSLSVSAWTSSSMLTFSVDANWVRPLPWFMGSFSVSLLPTNWQATSRNNKFTSKYPNGNPPFQPWHPTRLSCMPKTTDYCYFLINSN